MLLLRFSGISQNFAGGSFSQLKNLGTQLGVISSGGGNNGTLFTEDKTYNYDNIKIEGSVYLFNKWSDATFFINGKRYIVRNTNYNIDKVTFSSRLTEDSLFIFNSNIISKVVINSKIFNKFKDSKTLKSKLYEVLFSNDNLSILKDYYIKVIEPSPNPMLNRSTVRIIQKHNYFSFINGIMKSFKLNKKSILNILGDKQNDAKTFINKYNLSYKKENDIIKMLEYLYL